MKKIILILVGILVVIFFIAYITAPILISSRENLFFTSKTLEKTINNAIATNNPSLCEKLPTEIPDIQPRYECYVKTAIGLEDTSLCEKFAPKSYSCIASIAVAKKDIIICEKLSNNRIGQCQNKVAMETLDFTICNQIKDLRWRDNCFNEKAYNENDIIVCEEINSTSKKEDCFTLIAAKNHNIEICRKKIMNITIKDLCFERVARGLKELSMCETVPELKEPCVKIYGLQ